MRHNKKSNIGIIFESLIRNYTKSILESNNQKAKDIMKIIVKYFNNKSPLSEELSLVKVLTTTSINSFETGSRLLSEVKTASQYLDEEKIKKMKFDLIVEAYEVVGKDLFGVNIPNYRMLASVHQLINDYKGNVKIKNIKEKIALEEEVISNLIDLNKPENKLEIKQFNDKEKLATKLAYNIYNETFSNFFSKKEADVINEYLINPDFKKYSKVKFNEIKKELSESLESIKDNTIKEKIEKAIDKIETIKESEDKKQLAYNLILYQDLLNEIKK